LSTKSSDKQIRQFIQSYVKSKEGKITDQSEDVFTVNYPNNTSQEYTYHPTLSREKKIPLLTPGSPAFQQLLKECLEHGVLCQILISPRETIESLIRSCFKDSSFGSCVGALVEEELVGVKNSSIFHRINNGKIASVKVLKKEPVRYFQFYFIATFQNKLRSKNEEIITVLIDEQGNTIRIGDLGMVSVLDMEGLEIQDFKAKVELSIFDKLKVVAEEALSALLKEKLVLFDLTLSKEKKTKLRSFDKRLRRERREKVISRKHDFDVQEWHTNYEMLLKREEESYITNISVKFINLLIINASKLRFEVTLENKSTLRASLILGIDHTCEVTCPICRKTFSEGYATQDSLYVCGNCIRQSVDTGKIYSKKAALALDETLNEYFEHDSGFVCSVCGKRHSRLLEFKCNHDNSSVCIHHYDFCDICGKVFSKLNLSYTDEFKRKLCPKHASKNKTKEQ
jgi:hypothetical protein